MTGATGRAITSALAVGQAWLGASTVYLLALLAAAGRAPRGPSEALAGAPLRFVTLVPAHDEATRISETVAALVAQAHPGDRHEVVVIADNCVDATAVLAAEAGATVWEREAPDDRGKGQALAWALERLWRERPQVEAVAMVDADCIATSNLLTELDATLRGGSQAVQSNYVVSNPGESSTSALRYAGFALMHTVRPRGKERLGLSCGLFGTGMAFRADLLRAHPWSSFSVTEDTEYHLRLVEAGIRTRYAGSAAVRSLMPTSADSAREQQLRWESGNVLLARRTVPRLVRGAVARRDLQRIHAAGERLVPPQSILLAGSVLAGLFAVAFRHPRAVVVAVGTAVGQAVYVLGGLAVAGAPRQVFVAVLSAPKLILSKVAVFGRIFSGRGATRWVRTRRT